MQRQNKSPIGQILVNGGFLSQNDLELALAEQGNTNELLGKVLVRMGVLDPTDLEAALSVQKYLNKPEDGVRLAAGVRKMLGDLLIQAGHITENDLLLALAIQKRSGGRLGEVLLRMGLLNDRQLNCMLEFQQAQANSNKSVPGPLKLGEIMLAKGYFSRQQLDDALARQSLSGKKLGEILLEEGHVLPHHVNHGIRLQQMLLTAVLAGMLTACGGGGGGGESYSTANMAATENIVSTIYQDQEQQLDSNYFVTTSDDYGLLTPTFYYSTDNEEFWSIQADIADDVFDQNFRSIMRIQIPKDNGNIPEMNKTFDLEGSPQYEKFPGVFLIPNGQDSTLKKVEQGTISFEPDSIASEYVKGTFDVILTDYDSDLVPAPQYPIKGVFRFKVGTYNLAGAVPVAVSPLPPA